MGWYSPTMTPEEYARHDATALAAMVADGEVTPKTLLDAAVSKIEAHNPALNAVIYDMVERARDRVDSLPDGPLKGVPFLVKDLKLQIAGTPTSNSSRLTLNHLAAQSSELAKRYEAAGLQILGKTNTPEFGIMGITEPEVRGPCRNPWNLDHTPGGSSGGSSAAVAAGMVPAAHSGDGGGSIRIPASCAGLFGLKPTRGRVTMAPFLGEAWGGFVQEHVVCRSVRDSALFLDIEDPPMSGEPYAQPAKAGPWVEEVGRDPGTLRVGWTSDALFGGSTDPDCVAAVEDAASLLGELGHEVEHACPTFDREALVRAYFLTVASGVACFVEETAAVGGRRPRPSDFEPGTWILAQLGWKTSSAELVAAQKVMQRSAREVAAWFESFDVFLSPTMARPPARIGELQIQPAERAQLALVRRLGFKAVLDFALDRMASGKLSWTPNTQLFNQTGQPAMSVPLFWNSDGLPIGTQIAGRFGDEATLFRLASQLEEARPWADRRAEGY